jgi:hypothetical protein
MMADFCLSQPVHKKPHQPAATDNDEGGRADERIMSNNAPASRLYYLLINWLDWM